MISREPTIERLATARALLLEPFGLDESHLTQALVSWFESSVSRQRDEMRRETRPGG